MEEALAYGPAVLNVAVAYAALLRGAHPTIGAHQLINDSAALTVLTVRHGLEHAGVPGERSAERAAEYLLSDTLVNVPFNRISSLLYAALARRAERARRA